MRYALSALRLNVTDHGLLPLTKAVPGLGKKPWSDELTFLGGVILSDLGGGLHFFLLTTG